jgi:hypothetical protein
MAGLLHDVPLMLATLGGRGSETEAQRMTAELCGEKPACPTVRLTINAMARSPRRREAISLFCVYRSEYRTALDASKFHAFSNPTGQVSARRAKAIPS